MLNVIFQLKKTNIDKSCSGFVAQIQCFEEIKIIVSETTDYYLEITYNLNRYFLLYSYNIYFDFFSQILMSEWKFISLKYVPRKTLNNISHLLLATKLLYIY